MDILTLVTEFKKVPELIQQVNDIYLPKYVDLLELVNLLQKENEELKTKLNTYDQEEKNYNKVSLLRKQDKIIQEKDNYIKDLEKKLASLANDNSINKFMIHSNPNTSNASINVNDSVTMETTNSITTSLESTNPVVSETASLTPSKKTRKPRTKKTEVEDLEVPVPIPEPTKPKRKTKAKETKSTTETQESLISTTEELPTTSTPISEEPSSTTPLPEESSISTHNEEEPSCSPTEESSTPTPEEPTITSQSTEEPSTPTPTPEESSIPTPEEPTTPINEEPPSKEESPPETPISPSELTELKQETEMIITQKKKKISLNDIDQDPVNLSNIPTPKYHEIEDIVEIDGVTYLLYDTYLYLPAGKNNVGPFVRFYHPDGI